jgi:uncharacterized membrane protein YfhO
MEINMNNSSENNGRKILGYLFPGLITLLVMLIVLAAKGIWPFGSNRIDLFDNMQQVAPLYAHLWDAMHGKASIWFDWYTGLGTNVSMSISAFSMISPFNIFLYLCPRDYILEFISILTVIKTFVMSVTMYAFINKRYNELSYSVKALFAVVYAFCGYVLLYASCFTPWMDIVALFPLLMMALDVLEKTGKKLFYILMVAVMFIINYYLAAMSLVYILLVGGMYLIFRCDRKQRREKAWDLGIGTFTGIALSAFVLIPVFAQLSQSQRTGNTDSLTSQYLSWISNPTFRSFSLGEFERIMMFYGIGLFFVIIFTGIHRTMKAAGYKRNTEARKFNWYAISLIVIVIVQAIAEGTNIIWHFGSYNGYTLRNGYIIAFTLICLACAYADEVFAYDKPDKIKAVIQAVVTVIACAVMAVVYDKLPVNSYVAAFIFFIAVFAVMLILHIVGVVVMRNGYKISIVISLVAVEVFIGAFSMTGPPKFYTYAPYQYGDYVQLAVNATNNLEISESPVDRITNPDLSLNANYPLIMKRGSLSSFTAALQKDTQKQTVRWGHSKYFLWALDSGGTVFSDALLHITEAVNVNKLDGSLYTLEKQGTGDCEYDLYKANYQLPFAMVTNSNISLIDFNRDYTKLNAISSGDATENDYNWNTTTKDWIYLHNLMYSALSGNSEKLVTEYGEFAGAKVYQVGESQVEDINAASDNSATDRPTQQTHVVKTYKDTIKGRQAVYVSVADYNIGTSDANVSQLFRSLTITVNGKRIDIPTIGNVENKYYTTDYNNGLIYIGTFTDEEVEVQLDFARPLDNNGDVSVDRYIFTMGGIDLDKMSALCAMYDNKQSEVTYTNNSVTVKVNGSKTDNYAIVPIIKSDNWKVTVNGKECETKDIAGLFTGVAVNEGENEIVFTFSPATKNKALLISVLVLIVMIILMVVNHYKKICVPEWMKKCAGGIYMFIIAVLAVVMFAVPLIASIIANIRYVLGM